MITEENKKFIAAILVLLLAGAGVWFWLSTRGPREKEKSIESKAAEEEIARTKERLEELSRLTPEEKKEFERKREILSAQKVLEDVAVGGVSVIKEGNKKVLKNSVQGYRMELPFNLIVARSISSDLIELHDKDLMCEGDPSCEPVIRIQTSESNPKELNLGEWFRQEEKKAGGSIYTPREKINMGGGMVYRVTENIPAKFEGYYYYWSKEKRIYSLRISSFDHENYRLYVETFRFE